jgi:hypothetical protein
MKLRHFGLWFHCRSSWEWSTTISKKGAFDIYYDGHYLGVQWHDFRLTIYNDEPYIIVLKSKLPISQGYKYARVLDRPITIDDFEIVKNPDYRGDQ